MFNWPIFAMFFPGASWGAVSAEGLYWGLPLGKPPLAIPSPDKLGASWLLFAKELSHASLLLRASAPPHKLGWASPSTTLRQGSGDVLSLSKGQGSGWCLPASEAASREVLSLPMYPELTEAQQQEVAQAIREFYGG